MKAIITQLIVDSVKETIKVDNTICEVSRCILKSIIEDHKENKGISVDKVRDVLAVQNLFITTNDEDLASKNLSKEQILERIDILNALQAMTKSLFDDAFNALNKRLNQLKTNYDDDLSGLTKDELIDLVKKLNEEKEQK